MIHRFIPALTGATGRTLLLLHGTGGDENDLVEMGRELDPGALLSPRGNVLENGRPRFFRRLAEGVFDEKDVVQRAHELADFVSRAADQYQFDSRKVIAVGYSNGANIAAAVLLLRPETFAGAILFRSMVPLVPPAPPDLVGVRVLISSGALDPIVPLENAERLAAMLRGAGAEVVGRVERAGHQLVAGDIAAAKSWLREW